MEFVNTTQHGADLFNTVVGETSMLAAIVAKPVFRIDGERLIPDGEDPWLVLPAPIETEYGTLDGELAVNRRGVDFMLLGKAYAPNGKPVAAFPIDISVGDIFTRRLAVIGNRVWKKRLGSLLMTDPTPITEMPLTYAHAFGGECESEAGVLAWPANPKGLGFYADKRQAEGQPLPNLEHPEHLIENWNDQPDPVGTAPYPRDWTLRVRNGIELDERDPAQPKLKRILPTLFNNAHPALIIEHRLKPGMRVHVSNVTPAGHLNFLLPEVRYHAHVQLEDRHLLLPLHLDQIIVLSEEQRVVLSFRVCFTYDVLPFERRISTLYEGRIPRDIPDDYKYQLNCKWQLA